LNIIKKILFLGCNHDQIPYLKSLKAYPFKIIGTDLNPNPPGKSLCDVFYQVAYNDINGLMRIGQEQNFDSKDKVFTGAAQFAHKGAAHFASEFDIDYPSETAIDLCLNKVAYYERFKKLGIPIPITMIISTKEELDKVLPNLDMKSHYFLKSDYSKNPNYLYKFMPDDIQTNKVFWGRDRYLRECYILQQEFKGDSLRVNIYGNRFNVFQFSTSLKLSTLKKKLVPKGVIEDLKRFITDQGLVKWLVKFDIILKNDNYVGLDVGLDPPFRMVKEAEKRGIDFAQYYLEHYLNDNICYPSWMD